MWPGVRENRPGLHRGLESDFWTVPKEAQKQEKKYRREIGTWACGPLED